MTSVTRRMTSSADPIRYHRLARQVGGWWRPLVALVSCCLLWIAAWLALLVVALAAVQASPRLGQALNRALENPSLDPGDPVGAAVALGTLAVAVPAARGAARLAGWRQGLDSVAGRLRWRLLVRCLAAPLVVLALGNAVAWCVHPVPMRPSEHVGASLLVALALVPLQAAGEEYLFRGLLPQAIGCWLRSPLWGAGLSVAVFTVGHEYDLPGLASIAVFATAASYLTWRTGGLEAAIAWHLVNNLVVFSLQSIGLVDTSPQVGWDSAGCDVLMSLAVVACCEVAWRRSWSWRYRSTATTAVGAEDPLLVAVAGAAPVVATTASRS